METIYRNDYTPPAFLIPETELFLILDRGNTSVRAILHVVNNSGSSVLELDHGPMSLVSVVIDENPVDEKRIAWNDKQLIINDVPGNFTLSIEVTINPEENLALEGLYLSGGIYCTQNEPQGFRRIIPFVDRPDNMTIITTSITARQEECPVLLSNGNLVEQGIIDEEWHYAVWEDPFPKPVYLYALVAGDLGMISDNFTTKDDRSIDLRIYCDPGNEDRCRHALYSLKKAMAWDEERFNLSYDLDTYMIVAVDSFNMGAMENKGLNIFNSQYVLANPETATDANYLAIEGVVAHEYFHNWTGNRVTCRDWFQLTLKEGLTVFRDQEFTSDVQSRAVKRIEDVSSLRTLQFPEDAGPMSHPIRPDSYIEINNFYTLTVYEKGAEVIRMIHTMLGEDAFMKGMDLYFQRFDGQAVTCEDFVQSMEDASGISLELFRRWYSQSGTPVVTVERSYDKSTGRLVITLTQENRPTADQQEKYPLHIPLGMALLDKDGRNLDYGSVLPGGMAHLTKPSMDIILEDVPAGHYLSVNRGFSAPVILKTGNTLEEDIFLFGHDTDTFNRWDAGQRVFNRIIDESVLDEKTELAVPGPLVDAFSTILKEDLDSMYVSYLFALPSIELIAQKYPVINVPLIHRVIRSLKKDLAQALKTKLEQRLQQASSMIDTDYRPDREQAGYRSLRLAMLSYLCEIPESGGVQLTRDLFSGATNMTDSIGSLKVLVFSSADADSELKEFYDKWSHEQLVMVKWLALQSAAPSEDTLDRVRQLSENPVFSEAVPNLVRALYGQYSRNMIAFHREDGAGYRYIAEKILKIDASNPSMASSLAGAFKLYGRLGEQLDSLMKQELKTLLDHPLSPNTFEIVSKTLGAVN